MIAHVLFIIMLVLSAFVGAFEFFRTTFKHLKDRLRIISRLTVFFAVVLMFFAKPPFAGEAGKYWDDYILGVFANFFVNSAVFGSVAVLFVFGFMFWTWLTTE